MLQVMVQFRKEKKKFTFQGALLHKKEQDLI